MLQRTSFTFGPFAENSWLVWDEYKNCIIIDPGCYTAAEERTLEDFILHNDLKPVLLINTHAHIDHILGNAFVKRVWGLSPHLHPDDVKLYFGAEQYGAVWGIKVPNLPEPETELLQKDALFLGAHRFEIRFTPGHCPGEVCLVQHEHAFVIAGDVLFNGSIGRTDLPGGDYETLISSIKRELLTLPDHFEVCCGHGAETTIGKERTSNPFLS